MNDVFEQTGHANSNTRASFLKLGQPLWKSQTKYSYVTPNICNSLPDSLDVTKGLTYKNKIKKLFLDRLKSKESNINVLFSLLLFLLLSFLPDTIFIIFIVITNISNIIKIIITNIIILLLSLWWLLLSLFMFCLLLVLWLLLSLSSFLLSLSLLLQGLN